MPEGIEIRTVSLEELGDDFLDTFDRRQITRRIVVAEGDDTSERDESFIDDWDRAQRVGVIESLRHCISLGGKVLAASNSSTLLGFASLEHERFGERDELVELNYFHVTANARGQGIGRALFDRVMQESRAMGASGIYLGAHPSVESQRFYRAVGCERSRWIHPQIFAREPKDLQLVRWLDG